MGSGVSRKATGSFISDGAIRSVRTVQFRPSRVELVNVTSLASAEWQDTQADLSALKRVTAGTLSAEASDGVTPLSDGFSIGAMADINDTADEVVHWVAFE